MIYPNYFVEEPSCTPTLKQIISLIINGNGDAKWIEIYDAKDKLIVIYPVSKAFMEYDENLLSKCVKSISSRLNSRKDNALIINLKWVK